MLVGILGGGKGGVGAPQQPVGAQDGLGQFQGVVHGGVGVGAGGHDLGQRRNVEPDVGLFQQLQAQFQLLFPAGDGGQQVADHQLEAGVILSNAGKAPGLVAGHRQITHIQRHRGVVGFDNVQQRPHPGPCQVKGIVAAHQAAAAAHLKFGGTEAQLAEKVFQRLGCVGHKGVDGTGGAEPVGILLQQLGMVPVLEPVHAALHQDGPLHLVAVHQGQGLLGGKVGLAVVAILGEQVEHLAVAPGGLATADGPQFAAAAVAGHDLSQMQMCVNFLQSGHLFLL